MLSKQKTLNGPLTFQGKGLHSGLNVTMIVKPAPVEHGIVFSRVDLPDSPTIPALSDFVSDTSRSTTIERNGVRVSTIEHIMSALWSMGVDNALIELDAPEVPIMDGSAREYAKQISSIGLLEQDAEIKYYDVTRRITHLIEEKGVELTLIPDDEFSISVHIDYNSKVLGNQYAVYNSAVDFATQIAPCRTFVFLHELEPLFTHNMIKGGDLDNAIVIAEHSVSQEEIERLSKILNKKDVKVRQDGYLNNLELRFYNEAARHKLLDLMGDLALFGMRIRGGVIATRPGHTANTDFVKLIKKTMRKEGVKPSYKYNPELAPVYDINQIKNILPHRSPFLLVDRIVHIENDYIVGIKNVTMNEPFFVGHFPSEPVMPGVLIIEAMAQCGGLLAMQSLPDPENYLTFFMKIDEVRFKRKVVPGDTLQFELKMIEPMKRGIVVMAAKAFVAGQLATEAVLMAQISKK